MSYLINIHKSIASIIKEDWALTTIDLPISMDYDYLSLIEQQHKDQLEFNYALITKGGLTKGLICFQYLDFKGSYVQNFTKNEGESNVFKRALVAVFYWMLNWLNFKLLSTGNIFFTGEKAIYFDEDVDTAIATNLIRESFEKVKKTVSGRVDAYMLNNIYDNDVDYVLNYLSEDQYAAYPVDPDMNMQLNPDWKTLDDYKAALSSKYRVRMNKVLKECSRVEVKKLSYEEVVELNGQLHELYMNTASKVAFNLGYLGKDYFKNMKQLWKDDFEVICHYIDGQLIAFVSIWVEHQIVDVNYMGMDYTFNRKLKLYNRMLIDLVEIAIELKAKSLHLGRTATEMKSTIGASSREMHIYLTSPNMLIGWFMKLFEPYFGSSVYTLRNPYKKLIKE